MKYSRLRGHATRRVGVRGGVERETDRDRNIRVYRRPRNLPRASLQGARGCDKVAMTSAISTEFGRWQAAAVSHEPTR